MATWHEAALTTHVDTVRRRPARLEAASCIAGSALAALVAYDGSPGWRIARVSAVLLSTALIVVSQLRVAPRWRGVLSTSVGVPAFAIAVGFAPYLIDGHTAVSAVAIVLASAGLGLALGGTVVIAHHRQWWHRLAVYAGAFAVTGVVLLVVGPAVAATNVPRPAIGATPSSVGLEYEDVRLYTPDDVALAAWYVPSSNRAAVALLHGAGSTRSNVLKQAAVLARAGFGVLLVDARGHGESGGRAMDFGWYGDADIAAATRYLAARPDADRRRIGVVGISMGGEEALGASGSNELIRAVVAEGATARTAADEGWLSKVYGFRGLVQEQLERVQDWITDPLTGASPPNPMRSAVGDSNATRYLLITAGNVEDEQHAAAFIASGAPSRVEVWTVEGADHAAGLSTAPAEWATRVTSFLGDALSS